MPPHTANDQPAPCQSPPSSITIMRLPYTNHFVFEAGSVVTVMPSSVTVCVGLVLTQPFHGTNARRLPPNGM